MTNTNAKILAIQEQIAGMQKQLESLQSQLSELMEPVPAPNRMTVTTDEEFGDRLAAVMIEPEPPALYDLKMRFCRQFSTDGHKVMLRDATRESIRAYLENAALSLNLDNADRIGIKEDGPEFRRAALSIMDQLAKQSEPAPTKTPEPPAKKRSATSADVTAKAKVRFSRLFGFPLENVTVGLTRQTLLNQVENLVDATWLNETRGKEFWVQADRIMDKIVKKRLA